MWNGPKSQLSHGLTAIHIRFFRDLRVDRYEQSGPSARSGGGLFPQADLEARAISLTLSDDSMSQHIAMIRSI